MSSDATRSLPWGAMALFAAAVIFLGFLSGQAAGSTEDNSWFQTLTKPAWQPPGAVFGIVWTLLYALLGGAAAIVWASGHPARRQALLLFGAQLAANLTWSPLFFTANRILPALLLLVTIWVLALLTTLAFGRIDRRAAWMLVPYMAWLSYATVLNLRIWQLNG